MGLQEYDFIVRKNGVDSTWRATTNEAAERFRKTKQAIRNSFQRKTPINVVLKGGGTPKIRTLTYEGETYIGTYTEIQAMTGLTKEQVKYHCLRPNANNTTRWPAEHEEAAQRYALPELHKFLTMRWMA